jgi:hypothetical protein
MPEFLKCDAAPCDHVEFVEVIDESLIGKPCPKCGANLLTEADCRVWLDVIQQGIKLAESLGLVVDRQPAADQALLRIGFHDATLTTSLFPIAAEAPPKSGAEPEGEAS